MMMVGVRIMMKKMPTTTWSVAESCSGPEVAESLATTLPACTWSPW